MSDPFKHHSPSHFRHAILAAQRSGHRTLAEMLRPRGLTPAWGEVLTILATHGPMTIRQISEYIICEADHPSRLISRMEAKGLVKRETNPSDRRAVLISLTDKGRSDADYVLQADARLDTWLTQHLTEAQRSEITDTLEKLLKGVPEGAALKARYPKT